MYKDSGLNDYRNDALENVSLTVIFITNNIGNEAISELEYEPSPFIMVYLLP